MDGFQEALGDMAGFSVTGFDECVEGGSIVVILIISRRAPERAECTAGCFRCPFMEIPLP